MTKYLFAAFFGLLLYSSTSHAETYVRRQIYCESIDQRYNACETGLRRIDRLMLDRQRSRAACIEGQSFGINNRTRIAVSNGCRAWFSVEGFTDFVRRDDEVIRRRVPPRQPPRRNQEVVRCESIDGRDRDCYSQTLRFVNNVSLVRQLSNANCIPNRTFFALRNGVRVIDGCRGDFLLRGPAW